MMVSGAGSAPARSRMARSLACWTVKLPEIWPGTAEDRLADHRRRDHFVVEHDGERLADILPAWPRRICARRDELKRKLTIGSLVRWSKPGCASVRSAPETSTRFSIRYFSPLSPSRISESAGGCVCRRLLRRHRLIDHAEIEFRGLAENVFSRDGSCSPGTWTRMRSMPSRWMVGSTRPSSLTRRSMIWID